MALALSFCSASAIKNPLEIKLLCSSAVQTVEQPPNTPFDVSNTGPIQVGNTKAALLVVMDLNRTKFQQVKAILGKTINIYGVSYLVSEVKSGKQNTPACSVTLKRSGFSAPKK
ncbi:hypothetical protein [Deinococcus xinjiangensis]